MKTEFQNPVKYFIETEKKSILINDFIGKTLKIEFTGEINCIKCGAKTNKSFSQGFCYNCFTTAPETEECVLQPEKCQAHLGIARDMEFAKEGCLKSHYVYLSKTSNIKVGVTRESQVPTRWIDQGAHQAIKLAKTPYRQLAGEIEVELKQHFADKTQWQKMLKNITEGEELLEAKLRAIELLPEHLKKYIIKDDNIWTIVFPHQKNPSKIVSLKLDNNPKIEGILTGIKGQYLILDNEKVFNVRSHSGYNVQFEAIENRNPVLF
ncbi:MAG: DUF2797 domain-containing protein [Bacteroidales bacterium]|nr:DUF2797 domain-containing protein [Bacteroidales bacterium]